MSVIEELIRIEENGTLSFGNYLVESKKKVLDFEVNGDLYYLKTYEEVTKLEKNGKLFFEAVPGATVHNFMMDEKIIAFDIEGKSDIQITIELEPGVEYEVFVENTNVGNVKANLAGKVTFSVDINSMAKAVRLEKSI